MINHQRGVFPPPSTNMVFVRGEAELDNYPVTTGYTLWAKDLDAPVIYIKSVDIAGMTTKKIIDCNERQTSNNNESNYVTKDDLETLKQEIRTLLIPPSSPAPKKTPKAGETNV